MSLSLELGLPPQVMVEANRILQILINLILNAAQASPRNGKVVVRTRAETVWAAVDVDDDGPGISSEVAAHIFEPFFTTKPEGEGTGLGLSISHDIAAQHGGTLGFAPLPSGGTSFTLRLPARVVPRKTGRVALVVDDEPALLQAVTRVLSESFEVIAAGDADSALQAVKGTRLDLIVTDPLALGKRVALDLGAQPLGANQGAGVRSVGENSPRGDRVAFLRPYSGDTAGYAVVIKADGAPLYESGYFGQVE